MKHYLYRVQVVEYPEGAMKPSEYCPDFSYPDPEWKPEGWTPSVQYVNRMKTEGFVWPSTKREYKSRSSAMERKALIESFGAKCIIQRSSPITWPVDGEEKLS